MNLYNVFREYYKSFPLTPYNLIKTIILSLIVVELEIKYVIILSIIYIMPKP